MLGSACADGLSTEPSQAKGAAVEEVNPSDLLWIGPGADWLTNRLSTGGYTVTGNTGSALVAEGSGGKFLVWVTDESQEPKQDAGYKRTELIGPTQVLSDGVRFTWEADGYRVWVTDGPRRGEQVDISHIRGLVSNDK